LGFSVQSGALAPLGSVAAGAQPSALIVDPSGGFLYVANSLDATVSAYSINAGALTRVDSYSTGLQPVAIGIDPSQQHYLYTINFLGGNVSGFQVDSTNGSLINTQGSPYHANALPTAMAAIPHNTLPAK
jgi:6-phosphogluconolactonase (cycloisomerase 2 family)